MEMTNRMNNLNFCRISTLFTDKMQVSMKSVKLIFVVGIGRKCKDRSERSRATSSVASDNGGFEIRRLRRSPRG